MSHRSTFLAGIHCFRKTVALPVAAREEAGGLFQVAASPSRKDARSGSFLKDPVMPSFQAFLLCLAMLASMTSASLAATYRVSGAVTRSFSGFGTTLDSYDLSGSEISAPRGTAQYIGETDTPVVRGLGTSSASAFGLQASATASMRKDFAFGSTSRYNFAAGAFASGIWSDFIVTGPASPANILISVNLNIDGTTLAGTTVTPSGQSQASSSVQFNVRGNNQLSGGSFTQSVSNGNAPSFIGTGLLAGFDGNMDVTSALFSVPVNTPFSIELQLSVASNLSANFSEIFSLDANTNFFNTLTFAPIGPVFNLPSGYTINSAEAGIIDNTYVIPEPSSLILVGVGVGLISIRRIRSYASNRNA